MRNAPKTHKNNELDKMENPKVISPTENREEDPQKLEDSEPIDIRLEALSNYLAECKKNGIEVTPEMAEKEIRENLGIEVGDLLDKEIKDGEIREAHRDTAAEVEEMMSQKASERHTPLSYLREKIFKSNFAKAAFVTAMLFLKFNPAQAHEGDKKIDPKQIKKTEQSFKKNNNHEGGNDKTFHLGYEDFEKLGKKIEIKAANYFDTDKSDLKDADKLGAEFDKFFASIDSAHFEDLIERDWVIKGSSDERERPAGNEALTKNRISSFAKLFEERRAAYDFSKQLSNEQIEQVKEKAVSELYPTGGSERGVTNLTGLLNPDTQENYTKDELKKMKASSPQEYQKLLDKCRYTTFEVGSKIFEISSYDESIILADASPSMKNTQLNMASELEYLSEDKPVTVGNFSAGLHGVAKMSNSQEAAKKLSAMPCDGASIEKANTAAFVYLKGIADKEEKKLEKGEKITSKIMYIATDEGIQDANMTLELLKLAKKTNTTVKYLIFYEKGTKVIKLSLEELNDKVTKIAEAKIKAIQEQAPKNVMNLTAEFKKAVDRVMARVDGNYEMYASLKKAGITGTNAAIKQQLLANDFLKIHGLDNRLFKELKNISSRLNTAENYLKKADKLTIESQLGESLAINTFQDEAGKDVVIPITTPPKYKTQ